jgi:hypothetical protein
LRLTIAIMPDTTQAIPAMMCTPTATKNTGPSSGMGMPKKSTSSPLTRSVCADAPMVDRVRRGACVRLLAGGLVDGHRRLESDALLVACCRTINRRLACLVMNVEFWSRISLPREVPGHER